VPDSPSSSPIERLIERLIRRERIANSLAQEARGREVELFREIEALFRRIDPTEPTRARYRRDRTTKFIRELEAKLREHSPEMRSWLKDRLAVIGRAEAVAAETELVASLGAVGKEAVRKTPITQNRLRAILNTDPFQGRTLKEHAQRHSANTLDRVRTQVRLGMVNEEGIPDIVRRIRGRQVRGAARGFRGGVLQTNTRDAEALVRTAVTFVSNEGMLGTFRENPRVVSGVRYLAALDDRTTEICLALDGRVWPVDSDEIVIPGDQTHFNCRSILVPEIDYEGLGLDPPPEPDRIVRDLSTVDDEDLLRRVSARRRTGDFGDVTMIPSSMTADVWFRQQRTAVQNRLVGRTRADAFRAGEIGSLRDLVRDDLSLIPLDELLRN
jgi:SPP1 gp7 family putative phage head morphogenesis protein